MPGRPVRGWVWIPVALAFFLVAGWGLERADYFQHARKAMRDPAVPTAILNRGSMGRVLRHLRLVRPIHNDGKVHSRSSHPKTALDASLFQKKRVVGGTLYVANSEWVEDLVSRPELAPPEVSPDQFREGWPLLAVRVAPSDLYGRTWGIFANYWGYGREWERPVSMAYYVDGRQVFSSLAGIRLHGGMSRAPGKTHSLRLHFREEYGEAEFKKGLLFTPASEPIRRVVVKADWPQSNPFAGLLAFDMAERIGCVVPSTQPVLLVLNGELQTNIYWLSEHVGRSAWANRIGHTDFLMSVMKGQKETKSAGAYGAFHRWVLKTPEPLDLAAVEEKADLDRVSAYILAVAYGGVSDGFQGAALLDPRTDHPRWTWITWDLDHCFWDVYGDRSEREPWQKESWEHVYKVKSHRNYPVWRNTGDARSVLFTRLMNFSPVYRARFIRFATDMLNHRLTEPFMMERIDHYEQMARSFGRTDFAFVEDYREFVRRRPALLREGMQKFFEAGPVHRVDVRAPAGAALRIDGFDETAPYVGYYFDGQTVTVESSGGRVEHVVREDRVLDAPAAP